MLAGRSGMLATGEWYPSPLAGQCAVPSVRCCAVWLIAVLRMCMFSCATMKWNVQSFGDWKILATQCLRTDASWTKEFWLKCTQVYGKVVRIWQCANAPFLPPPFFVWSGLVLTAFSRFECCHNTLGDGKCGLNTSGPRLLAPRPRCPEEKKKCNVCGNYRAWQHCDT